MQRLIANLGSANFHHMAARARLVGRSAAAVLAVLLSLWTSGARAANVAWVSFHSSADTPAAGAAGAGATVAPDKDYTDLLQTAGHTVTRFITSDTPDVFALNSFDLVVISRSVNSAHYELDAETAAWNGITAPMMMLSGYVLRNVRLGFTTGGTIPDTAGPIKLTTTFPTHPIFAGVALDATNTMVNDYTIGLPLFNGVEQRGISVNTDPIVAGGTILATVSAAGDPANGGMIIGEFPAGTTMGTTPPDVLGGKRMVFLTGGRETNGVNTETAGIFDLTAAGATLFRNAVNYLASAAPQAGDVNLDGLINLADYTIIKSNFFLATGATRALGDLTADGRVDLADFVVWKNSVPASLAANLGVPEPTAFALMASFATALACLGRQPKVRAQQVSGRCVG